MIPTKSAREEYIGKVKEAYDELLSANKPVSCTDIAAKTKYSSCVIKACLRELGLEEQVVMRKGRESPASAEEVYAHIKGFYDKYHMNPSLRELADDTGISLYKLHHIVMYLAVVQRIAYFTDGRRSIHVIN